MSGMMEGSGLLALVVAFIALMFAVVSVMVPFFILRIRNEVIETNQKLDRIISLLERR